MEFAGLLLKQNLIMLFYLGIGYFLFKKKLVNLQGSADIARLLLYIVMPMAILNSYLTEFTMEKLKALGFSFVAAALALLLSILVSRFFFASEQPVERFSSAFSNAEIKKLAETFSFHYIDVNARLTDECGKLKKEYTVEGVHMYANAYRIILENLKPYL